MAAFLGALTGAFTSGSLRGPLEIAVGCAAVLLAEGLALLALVPENLRARAAARGALIMGGLALVLAAVVGIGYRRVSLDPRLVNRYTIAYQVTAICATWGGWLLAILTACGLVWGALAVLAPAPLDASDSSPVGNTADPQRPAWQPTPSRWDRRRAAFAQARRWLWPWLDLFIALIVVSLVVVGIRTVRVSTPGPPSAADLAVSFGNLMVWALLVGTMRYRRRRLSRAHLIGWLAVASLMILAHLCVDVASIMTS